ncbi:MAG TPA: hypothetical protein VNI77_10375 [Nitrososphaera sp.]|nr:hypothetical protein [Nitrososphaera sp.]
MAELIDESYRDTTVNTILKDIHKKYKIDTSKDLLKQDVPIDEMKFKYRIYFECVRMLYKKAGVA